MCGKKYALLQSYLLWVKNGFCSFTQISVHKTAIFLYDCKRIRIVSRIPDPLHTSSFHFFVYENTNIKKAQSAKPSIRHHLSRASYYIFLDQEEFEYDLYMLQKQLESDSFSQSLLDVRTAFVLYIFSPIHPLLLYIQSYSIPHDWKYVLPPPKLESG